MNELADRRVVHVFHLNTWGDKSIESASRLRTLHLDATFSHGDKFLDSAEELIRLNRYDFVASIEFDASRGVTDILEDVFSFTQNVHQSWIDCEPEFAIMSPSVSVRQRGGARSTSVGDVCIVDGRYFVVSGIGYDEVRPGKLPWQMLPDEALATFTSWGDHSSVEPMIDQYKKAVERALRENKDVPRAVAAYVGATHDSRSKDGSGEQSMSP